MTHASRPKAARPGAITLRAMLSRLVVALAFVLFGVPQVHADMAVTHAGAGAQSQIEQSLGIVKINRNLLRAQPTDEPSPDGVVSCAVVWALPRGCAATLAPAAHVPPTPIAIRILPPVRGPPAV